MATVYIAASHPLNTAFKLF